MKNRHSVIPRTLCFVFYQDEVLLIKGGATKEWSGICNGLGGHIEKGENIISSTIREIEEESGLKPKNTKLRGVVHVTDFFGKDIMMFVTTSNVDSKKVIESPEGELLWVKIDELNSIKVFEDIVPILNHVLNMKPDEVFFGTSVFDGKDKLKKFKFSLN